MSTWLIQVKREFWEHQTSFVILPSAIAALVVATCIYVVTMHSATDSGIGMELFGQVYYFEPDPGAGVKIDFTGEGAVYTAGRHGDTDEYIIDFTRGEMREAEDSDYDVSLYDYRHHKINSTLHGIHSLFIFVFGFVLMFYLLSCLHTDRKDRSVLFWKSLPVSESRNVAVKLIVTTLAVPLLVTIISWVVQICYLGLSMIFIYRIGSDPWEIVWPHVDILPVFFEQLKFALWGMAWWLPVNAWLLLSSALAKRSPFLVATIPFVVLIIMENLLFGTWRTGTLLLEHAQVLGIQMAGISGDTFGEFRAGSVDIFLDNTEMITGFVIAGLLFPATVWLRNNRFEI